MSRKMSARRGFGSEDSSFWKATRKKKTARNSIIGASERGKEERDRQSTTISRLNPNESTFGKGYEAEAERLEYAEGTEGLKGSRKPVSAYKNVSGQIADAIRYAISGEKNIAESLLRQVERVAPENLDVLYNMAMLQMECGRYNLAYDYAEKFLRYHTDSIEMLRLQGFCRLELGHIEQAEVKINQALELDPNDPQSLVNMANVLLHRGCLEIAQIYAEKALAVEPLSAIGKITLANILIERGEIDKGIEILEVAKKLDSTSKLADFNQSFAYFSKGERQKGYRQYEYRYLKEDPILTHARASYAVDRIEEYQRIALLSEQGFGDTVQFCRYARWLARDRQFLSVSLFIQDELVSIVSRALPEIVVKPHTMYKESSEVGAVPLLSCPYLFGEHSEDADLHAAYLRVNDSKREYWEALFSQFSIEKNVKKIALVWQGNPQAERTSNRGRSIPLSLLEPIAKQEGLVLVGLQKGVGLDQYSDCRFKDRFTTLQDRINSSLDFEDTLAILACCDLLITVDTVVAHIAGAAGLPVWLLLSHKPDWRWGGDGKSTFWYQNMTSFVQKTDGEWEAVVQQVVDKLSEGI